MTDKRITCPSLLIIGLGLASIALLAAVAVRCGWTGFALTLAAAVCTYVCGVFVAVWVIARWASHK